MADKFDHAKVADLAKQIDKQIEEVESRQQAKRLADGELNSAQVRLANLRSQLTHAIDGQLDMASLKQRAPERYPV